MNEYYKLELFHLYGEKISPIIRERILDKVNNPIAQRRILELGRLREVRKNNN